MPLGITAFCSLPGADFGRFCSSTNLQPRTLAKLLHVPASRVNDIVLERRGVTADTALRLTRCFGGDAQSWLYLQSMYDLRTAEISTAQAIAKEVEPFEPAHA
ncbi:HigA family addiction module antidote protein [bacterium BD-1]|nr:HigA family addiction module antidote protein [Ottowia caeni]